MGSQTNLSQRGIGRKIFLHPRWANGIFSFAANERYITGGGAVW